LTVLLITFVYLMDGCSLLSCNKLRDVELGLNTNERLLIEEIYSI